MTNYRLLNKYITEEIDPNAVYVLSLSYGKDSLACLGAIEKLGLPLHRIVHAEVWATDTIPAELPPMMEFKARADEIIERRWGIKVEHICATKKVCGGGQQKLSYEQMFYNVLESGQFAGTIKGFPLTIGSWCKKLKYENGAVDVRRYILSSCAIAGGGGKDLRFPDARRAMVQLGSQNASLPTDSITGFATKWSQYCTGELKRTVLRAFPFQSTREIGVPNSNKGFSKSPNTTGGINVVQYLGIAADEPLRIEKHAKRKDIILPLAEIGWDEDYCGLWAKYNDLLSPTYTTATRSGCWFCHNQGVEQLRLLRKNYPDLWEILLKWDKDSPTTFKPDGHTVRDFDKRFEMEDKGIINPNDTFRWKYLTEPPRMRQMSIFDI